MPTQIPHCMRIGVLDSVYFFFLNDTATTEIYTLSLHDALPISGGPRGRSHAGIGRRVPRGQGDGAPVRPPGDPGEDRKSTRLNSSHTVISYAVFCLKKKKILPWFYRKLYRLYHRLTTIKSLAFL